MAKVKIKDGMRLKHGTQAQIIVRSGKLVLEDDWHNIEGLGGAMTVLSVKYNALAMSGGTAWHNPITGESIKRPRVSVLVREEDVLTGDQECNCADCLDEEGGENG